MQGNHQLKNLDQEIKATVARTTGTIIRNIELNYSRKHPFDLVRKSVLAAMGDRGLAFELSRLFKIEKQRQEGGEHEVC